MKFTKHTCTPYRLKGREVKTAAGHLFQFDDYPGVDVFVFRDPKYSMPLYFCVEPTTGMSMAAKPKTTRKAAIEAQHETFERMRTGSAAKGSHANVVGFVNKCTADAMKP